MNRVDRLIATGLAFGMCASIGPEVSPPAPFDLSIEAPVTLTPAQHEVLEDTQEEIVAKWASLKTVNFVILERDQTFTCNPLPDIPAKPYVTTSTSDRGPYYCHGNDAVIIEAAPMNLMGEWINVRAGDGVDRATAVEELVVAHEYGHGRQWRKKMPYESLSGTPEAKIAYAKTIELQADCLAGEELAAIDPAIVPEVEEVLSMFQMEILDPTHGGGRERAEHFAAGAAGEDCWSS